MPRFQRYASLVGLTVMLSCTSAIGQRGQPALKPPGSGPSSEQLAVVRRELEARYAENAAAFVAKDTAAVNRLRAPGYHTETPEGLTHSRAEMEAYTAGLFMIVERFDSTSFRLDSMSLRGDTAVAVTLQQSTRWQHLPNTPSAERHRVTVSVRQREQWVKGGAGWLLWRVDQVHDQRRWIDGALQVPNAPWHASTARSATASNGQSSRQLPEIAGQADRHQGRPFNENGGRKRPGT